MFVNRAAELDELRRVLARGNGQLIRLYGRRRVGKTELLRKVALEGNGLYLLVDEADRPQQLQSLSRQIAEQANRLRMPLSDWDDFFNAVSDTGVDLVVIDEFQRLLQHDRQAATRLQARWDQEWRTAGPSIALCGSSVGMMQALTAGKAGPLFGRLTADIRLRPFDYPATRLMYPHLDEVDRVIRFAVFGGTPFYHALGVQTSLEEAVRDAFLSVSAPFLDEPQQLLRSELESPVRHNSILYEVGTGTHYLRDLEQKVGVARGGLGPYLQTLRHELDLVRMEDPVCGKQRQARYVMSDPFFEFYYRFVFANRPLIELGRGARVWEIIKADLDTYVGRLFETVVRDVLLHHNGSQWDGFNLDFDRMGRWWNRSGDEIDLVAEGPNEIWAIEVSWSKTATRIDDWARLLDRIPKLQDTRGKPIRPVMVSRGGFDRKVVSEARRHNAWLVDWKVFVQLAEATESLAAASGHRSVQ